MMSEKIIASNDEAEGSAADQVNKSAESGPLNNITIKTSEKTDGDVKQTETNIAAETPFIVKIEGIPARVTIEVTHSADQQQMQLCSEIERTQVIIAELFSRHINQFDSLLYRQIKPFFPKGNNEQCEISFNYYLNRLYRIATLGLKSSANTQTATAMLRNLQDELLSAEGARVKNSYMKSLGWKAALFTGGAFLLRWLLPHIWWDSNVGPVGVAIDSLLLMWAGAMVGCWLSFGIRNVEFTFANLGQPESDLLRPNTRLIFVGLLTITLGLIFMLGVAHLEIGGIKTEDLWQVAVQPIPGDPKDVAPHPTSRGVLTALLIGLFCGISEKALSSTIGNRAAQTIGQFNKQ